MENLVFACAANCIWIKYSDMFNSNAIEHVFTPPCTVSLHWYITFLRYILGQTIKPVFLFAATIYQVF